MSKIHELAFDAEKIDELFDSVDKKTIYQDATQSEHGLMSTTDKTKLDNLPTAQQLETSLSGKVDVEEGKGLSKNDYTDVEKESVASAYHKPQNGIPKTDLDSSVQTSLDKADTALQSFSETDPTVPSWAKQPNKPSYNYSEIGNTPDLSGFITKSVNDLTNYYLKTDTYTQAEVNALIGAIQQFHYEIYATLPQTGRTNVLYLIGPTGSGSDRYEEYVYANSAFTKIGDTSIDLSGYVTTSALNTALADYVTSENLNYLLRGYANAINTTYSQLKILRNGGSLLTGAWYRITDYECTTSQENTRSAGHQFDILVQAIDEGHLSEEAKACRHSVVYGSMVWNDNAVWSDGDDYFANSKLEAWKIWYRLDNDTERFAWAVGDSSGGEGETYFYKTNIEKFDDEVDYGDKMVLDGTIEIDGETYYKWRKYDNDEETDYYVLTTTTDFTGASLANPIDGIAGSFFNDGGTPTNVYDSNRGDQIVEFHGNSAAAGGKGVIYRMIDEWGNDCPYDFKNMLFKRYRIDECVKSPDLEGLFGIDEGNEYTVDTDAAYWCYTFCMIDTSDNTPHDVSVEQDVFMNDEGYYQHNYNNVMKAYHEADYDGDPVVQKMYLPNNVFVTDTDTCSIDEGYGEFYGFYANTLGSYCNNNTFGNYFQNNTFGNYFQNNTFGNGCGGNTFGNSCGGNTFGNYFQNNTFGNSCYGNTFGNSCGGNTFGNYFQNNTFGNSCYGNTFGNYVRQLTVFEGVTYCSITGGSSSNSYVQKAQILNGTSGYNNSNKLTITFVANVNYTQIAGKNSGGVLKIWTPADMV